SYRINSLKIHHCSSILKILRSKNIFIRPASICTVCFTEVILYIQQDTVIECEEGSPSLAVIRSQKRI
ncbi:hypothetical protein V2G26_010536, partial [Clonostachys chloroleuca]